MLGLGLCVPVAGIRCRRLSHHIPQLGGREAIDRDAAGQGGGLEDVFGSGRDVHGGEAQNGADTLDFDDAEVAFNKFRGLLLRDHSL
jgi:hypothetical protein